MAGQIEKFLGALTEPLGKAMNGAQRTLLNSINLELVKTLRRVSEIKNLIYRERAAQLRDIFVEPNLKTSSGLIDSGRVFSDFLGGQRIVVRGSAGLGKSVLLKHFCLKHVDDMVRFAPLFLELRKLNDDEVKDIVVALHNAYVNDLTKISIEEMRTSLTNGGFSVILDGYDEVNSERKPLVESAILKFSENFPACPLLVSGRNDPAFYAWERFHVYDVAPMTSEKTVELISKLQYNEELKDKFIKEAVPKLFSNQDKSFVQTPLLAVLMMLTYELYGEVPNKMHLFYASAFETLLRGHDVTKSQFRRNLICGLQEEDFKRVFAAFCAITYSDQSFQFSKTDIIRYINEAVESCCVKVSPSDVLDDLVLSICVMQYEGLEYSFVHRSFQEYFTAVYLRESPLAVVTEFFERGYHPARETVVPMLFGMDRDRIEKDWCLPSLKSLVDSTEGQDIQSRLFGLFSNYFERFGFTRRKSSLVSVSHPGRARYDRISVLEHLYPMTNRSMWWFDGWQPFNNRSGRMIRALEAGEIPDNAVIKKETVRAINEETYTGAEYKFDLSKISPELYKKIGLWSYGKEILDHIDKVYADVEQRVERRSSLSSRLFRRKLDD